MDLGPWERARPPPPLPPRGLVGVLDWFIPADQTDPASLSRARILVGGCGAIFIAQVPLTLHRWIADGGLSIAVLVSFFALVVVAFVPFLLRWTRSPGLAGAFAVTSMFIALTTFVVAHGGLDAGAVLFLPLLIILGFFFVGPSYGAAVAAVVVAEVLILAALHSAGYAFPPPPEVLNKRAFIAMGLGAAAFAVATIAWLYERELHRSAAAVRVSERRYALAADGANDVLWDWDIVDGTLDVSKRLSQILGDEDVVLWERIHPDDRVRVRAALTDHVTDRAPCRAELRMQTHEGGWRWFDLRGQAVWDGGEAPLRMAGSLRDITAHKAAESAIADHARDLAPSNAELEKFAYVASHDLSEPLRTVSSFSQLLVRKYGDPADEEAETYVGYIVGGARRMRALIDGLLAYARVGKHEPAPELVDCSEAVASAVAGLAKAIADTDATITYDGLPTVSGNSAALTQVFTNLIGNSLKFCEQPPEITIRARSVDERWVVEVRDNGIGILDDMHDRIFEIFQRLHGDAEYEGTGIGLAICKKIVERHDGRLWLESTPGEGTSFFIELPQS